MSRHSKEFKLTREVNPSLSTIQSSFSANLFISIGRINTQVHFIVVISLNFIEIKTYGLWFLIVFYRFVKNW